MSALDAACRAVSDAVRRALPVASAAVWLVEPQDGFAYPWGVSTSRPPPPAPAGAVRHLSAREAFIRLSDTEADMPGVILRCVPRPRGHGILGVLGKAPMPRRVTQPVGWVDNRQQERWEKLLREGLGPLVRWQERELPATGVQLAWPVRIRGEFVGAVLACGPALTWEDLETLGVLVEEFVPVLARAREQEMVETAMRLASTAQPRPQGAEFAECLLRAFLRAQRVRSATVLREGARIAELRPRPASDGWPFEVLDVAFPGTDPPEAPAESDLYSMRGVRSEETVGMVEGVSLFGRTPQKLELRLEWEEPLERVRRRLGDLRPAVQLCATTIRSVFEARRVTRLSLLEKLPHELKSVPALAVELAEAVAPHASPEVEALREVARYAGAVVEYLEGVARHPEWEGEIAPLPQVVCRAAEIAAAYAGHKLAEEFGRLPWIPRRVQEARARVASLAKGPAIDARGGEIVLVGLLGNAIREAVRAAGEHGELDLEMAFESGLRIANACQEARLAERAAAFINGTGPALSSLGLRLALDLIHELGWKVQAAVTGARFTVRLEVRA
ncbi:MAG: hypothetical protein ACYCW6_04205 [Candidatus Xenobia bacterium]